MRAKLDLGDGPLELLPERAVWRPREKTLFVADLHLGKATAFRAFGVPAPTGASDETLRRLGRLVDAVKPERVVVLGDFVHAAVSMSAALTDALKVWHAERVELDLAIVLGNHDRRAGGWLNDLGFEVAEAPAPYAGCECRHFPIESEEALREGPTTLAGHLHPMTRLHGPGRDSLRLPCFVVSGRQVVLPAFGEFTGGHFVQRDGRARLMAATEIGVFEAG
jgi:DNA ligase-associated metallophosphoesterase